jgi:hypothetical protein
MNVDDLIDRVARDLTAGEPSAALSREIQTRIAALPRRRPWPWWAAPAVGLAAAAVVVAVISRPRSHQDATALQMPAPVRAASVDPPAAIAVAIQTASDPSATSPAIARRRTARAPAPNPVLTAWQERAVTALPGVPPLVIDRIQPSDLSIPLMEVEPLGTAPLSVPAGSSSGG